jgi:hypothetical protein
MNKTLDNFLEEIKRDPKQILLSKYENISLIFPQEYIKALKMYINILLSEIHIYHIRSKL